MSQKLLIDADLVGNAQASDAKAEAELAAKFSLVAKEGTAPLAQIDPETGEVVFDGSWKMGGSGGGSGMPIGTSIAVYCTSAYSPFGAVPQDGATYTESQFPNVVEYIEGGLLPWKTLTDYDAEVDAHGKCACFAWDSSARTFRVPYVPDGTLVQQAMSDAELGKSYDAGLPSVTGNISIVGNANTGFWGNSSGAFRNSGGSSSAFNGGGTNSTVPTGFTFDASRSSALYGASSTVQPSAVALRHFVVVATETDQQSVMDWSAWATSLAGKVNTSQIDYACVINGNTTGATNEVQDNLLGNSGVVSTSSRYILKNPFGNSTPVICVAETFMNNLWSNTGFIYSGSGHGVAANYVQDIGIVVQTGGTSLVTTGHNAGGGHGSVNNHTSAPCRVHVWKVKGV